MVDLAGRDDAEAETELRARLRDLVASHLPPRPKDKAERLAWARRFQASLYDAGLAAPSWPVEAGGMGLTVRMQLVHHDELAKAGAPSHPAPIGFIVGPTLVAVGTEAQRERFLRPLLRAEELWCQGFSEPGAGSDLTALTTKAVRDGDDYVLTGQKVWTTGAQQADWMFALVRTGPAGPNGAGITYLLLPMDSPGLEVRALRDITGTAHFAEVFFDEVRVPVANRVGAEGEGWQVARTSLGFERSTAFAAGEMKSRALLERIVGVAARTGALTDPLIRQEIARAEADVRISGQHNARALADALAGRAPGPLSSLNRLGRAESEQRLHELALRILGPDALLGSGPDAPDRGAWAYGYLMTRASTIGAGTSQIQRNTLAEKVLGLPRD
ncbi:acyl-CoA dehydrogenase family protein [Sporichthya brevicatena]|uniref:Acyl-CoA dehydrogenase family protein n=1 Tax=Sporichthya brevicatena TaxID=171442 RepID=A0ABN1GRI4_9ACTN